MGLSGNFWVPGEKKGAELFTGGNTVNLDAKGRLALPVRYRSDLLSRCDGQVVVTVHNDHCLMMYPRPDWDEIERKLVRLPNQNRRTRTLQRMFLGHASELEMDKNGRVLLPPRLREFANLGKRVVLVGLVNKFEIWNEEAWEKDCAEWLARSGDEGNMPDSLESLTL